MINALLRVPSKTDSIGYIYGFREKKSYNQAANSYWIKIGKTTNKIPQTRIQEWEKNDK